jgi:hypothetical protein
MSTKTSVQVRLDDADREALDSIRRSQPHPPSRSAAARMLLHERLRLVDGKAMDGELQA